MSATDDPRYRLRLEELAEATPAVPLFRRRFGHPPPSEPCHVGAWVEGGDKPRLACYIHFHRHGNVLLGGGACVDPRALREVSPAMRRWIRARGGLYHLTLTWAMQHFAGRYRAVFGYCGDVLAERVDRAVGFVDTGHEHLLVYWLDEVDEDERATLIASAHAVGPF